jgi:tRNA modification GTPase
MNDTICAISTPAGLGAIAVARTSGAQAFDLAATLFKNPDIFLKLPPNQAKYAEIYDGDRLLDQVVAVKYAAPHTYTGEDLVEISCHGSLYIQRRILEMLIERGCRMALPGEFTQRAFVNGKLDLPQAEAVADLIASQSETAHRLAVNQLKGGISQKLHRLRDELVELSSLLELELDFSEEDVEFADREKLNAILISLQDETQHLIRSFKLGNAIKNGIPVAIAGKPNVGKSTLLNALLQHERAIVSDIPGTTRDTVEDTFTLNGTLFRFIDTAGIRRSDDRLENIGIERTYQAVGNAAVVLYMTDAAHDTAETVRREVEELKSHVNMEGKLLLLVANKIDQTTGTPTDLSDIGETVYISAKQQTHIHDLEQKLMLFVEKFQLQDLTLITNERHYALLTDIHTAVERMQENIQAGITADLLAEDVRTALFALGNLTGTVSTDDILDNIFGKFCIGK